MSKTLSITRKLLYQVEFAGIVIMVVALIVAAGMKIITLSRPVTLPASANMQQLQLQNALNILLPPASAN